MKNADIFSELGKLSLKYATMGLTIDFEFDRFGMTLNGWLDRTLDTVDIYEFKRKYTYQEINVLSDLIGIEEIVDEFKNELWASYASQFKEESKFVKKLIDIKNKCTVSSCDDCPFAIGREYKYKAECCFNGVPAHWNGIEKLLESEDKKDE